MLALPRSFIRRTSLYLPPRVRRGAAALWRETSGEGGWPCCCPGEGGSTTSRATRLLCSACGGSGPTANQAWRVYKITLSLIKNIQCTTCTSFNADYYVTYWTTTITSGITNCYWRVLFEKQCAICNDGSGIDCVLLQVGGSPSTVFVAIGQSQNIGAFGTAIHQPLLAISAGLGTPCIAWTPDAPKIIQAPLLNVTHLQCLGGDHTPCGGTPAPFESMRAVISGVDDPFWP
jgi:hypothetical protein